MLRRKRPRSREILSGALCGSSLPVGLQHITCFISVVLANEFPDFGAAKIAVSRGKWIRNQSIESQERIARPCHDGRQDTIKINPQAVSRHGPAESPGHLIQHRTVADGPDSPPGHHAD
ncbi:MAG: hypothetical protein P4L90_05215 [Rhodopila sp.]|nr:hypothetical protein [Rhodopila sp.]